MAISMYKKHHQYDQVSRITVISKLLYYHRWDQVNYISSLKVK
jgi:hypothetical protein